MKRLISIILFLLLLTGCSLVPNEYSSSKPHESMEQVPLPEAVVVTDAESLKDAILRYVKAGSTEGSIRAANYDGNVEEDLVQAVYDVARLDPVGAYAVDYIGHNCARIVGYYEIRLNIVYRRTARDIASIQMAYSPEQLQGQVERALMTYDDHLALQVNEGQEFDIAAIVERYCLENPAEMVETPDVQTAIYPESGTERIVEVNFLYHNTPEELTEQKQAVEESVSAAAEYIRYRSSDRDKTQLLYTYLTERFTYKEAPTTAPVYSALCEGTADPLGLSQGFRLICRKAGVTCYTVKGLLDGQEHYWNIVSDDGDFRHVDLYSCVTTGGGIRFMTDWEMGRYYWNGQDYPVCVAAVEEQPAEEVTEIPEEETLTDQEEPV